MLHFELATRYTAVETIGHVRAIAGTYIALSRSDRETDAITTSDDVRRLDHAETLQVPTRS